LSENLKLTEGQLNASKKIAVKINIEKSKNILTCCHKKVGQNYNIKIDTNYFGGAS
jgi:hypothetical protein